MFNSLILRWKWVRVLKCSAYKTSYLAPSWVKILALRTKRNACILFWRVFLNFVGFILHLLVYKLYQHLFPITLWISASLQRTYILISALCIYISWAEMWTYWPFSWSLFIQKLICIKTLWDAESGGPKFKITTNSMKCGKNSLCRVPLIFATKCSYFRSWWLTGGEICQAHRNHPVLFWVWEGKGVDCAVCLFLCVEDRTVQK